MASPKKQPEQQQQLTPEDVARLENERAGLAAALLARTAKHNPSSAAAAPAAPATGLAALAQAARDADARRQDERRAEARLLVGDLVERASSAMTSLGIMRAKNLVKVQEVLGLPFAEIRRSLPHDFVLGAGVMVSPSLTAINELERLARDLNGALQSTLSGARRSGNDLDPPDLAACAEEVQQRLAAVERPDLGISATHDIGSGQLAGEFKRVVLHLKTHVQRAEALVANTRVLLDRFAATYAKAEKLLAEIVPASDVKPLPDRVPIQRGAEARPTSGGTSRVDFDPREPVVSSKPSGPAVQRLHEGWRVGGGA